SGDPMTAATVGIVSATLVAVPVAVVGWLAAGRPAIPPAAVGLAIASGVLETAYFVCLSSAYRHGDLSVVYPTARGTAPMLAVAIGVVVFGERLDPVGAFGVALLLGGLVALTRPWRVLVGDPHAGDRTATAYAVATGIIIATYSAIDRTGARLTEPWLYAALIWPAMAGGLLAWRWLRVPAGRRRPIAPLDAEAGGPAPFAASRAVIGGLITLVAYALILFAYTQAPLTAVAPLRESAVVLASGWGALRLGEAEGRRDAARRLFAAGLVAVGIVLLALEG
ncbi:MAG TPA: EamA family transporter, partial [Candidatus Dormibacteraeota bacterium]|nr:EamA family transporter [Candidatus Dormibacteraeota bacterium]